MLGLGYKITLFLTKYLAMVIASFLSVLAEDINDIFDQLSSVMWI